MFAHLSLSRVRADRNDLGTSAVCRQRQPSRCVHRGENEVRPICSRMGAEDAMFVDVEARLNKGNKILFSRDSPCLQELTALMRVQNHRTLVMWALDCAKGTLAQFESKYPHEPRPRICLAVSEQWARGEAKMPAARHAILDAHQAAKEIGDSAYGALCHAIGHAGATVHVASHALGLPMYELTAIVLSCDPDGFRRPVTQKIHFYYENLLLQAQRTDTSGPAWAKFLLDDANISKESAVSRKRTPTL